MDEIYAKIISKSEYRQLPKNTRLLKEGDLCQTFVHLKRGVVRHSFINEEGEEITKNFIMAPAYFLYSLTSFLTQTASVVQCETLTDVELYELSMDDFNGLLSEVFFSKLWNGMLTNFIIKKEKKEMSLMKDNALERYERFLRDFPGLLNEIPHYYIASYLSISPETLSRIRKSIS